MTQTAAGPTPPLEVLIKLFSRNEGDTEIIDELVRFIRQEAVAAFARDLAEKVWALDYRMVEWSHEDGTYSLHQVVTWSEVLALLDAGVPQEER